MDELPQLRALQRALIHALTEGKDPSEDVRPHAPTWVQDWSPEAVRVARTLVDRWSRRPADSSRAD